MSSNASAWDGNMCYSDACTMYTYALVTCVNWWRTLQRNRAIVIDMGRPRVSTTRLLSLHFAAYVIKFWFLGRKPRPKKTWSTRKTDMVPYTYESQIERFRSIECSRIAFQQTWKIYTTIFKSQIAHCYYRLMSWTVGLATTRKVQWRQLIVSIHFIFRLR